MFTNYLKWRKENDIDHIEDYDFNEALQVKKVYPHGYHKMDKNGRPIYIEILSECKIDEVFKITSEDRMQRYYIKEYERTLRYRFDCCGIKTGKIVEQSLTILCVKDLGITILTGKTKRFLKIASDIGQDYYPEMLGSMYLINSGFWFSALWSVVKNFIDKKTVSKIHVVGSDFLKELAKHTDVESLPKKLGGKCECSHVNGGCFYSDLGPWNSEGVYGLRYSKDMFDKVK